MKLVNLTRKQLRITGAAFALSAGLVACGNNDSTSTPISDGRYNVTVNFTGVSGKQTITVKAASGTTETANGTYTMNSGGILHLVPGTYTISMPTIGGKTPTAQTVTVINAAQTITFAY
ncbi:hypothetical protein [Deinococcus fonticola]|uniref:hypothetical protein n=1 Tax=Deinococcus fonticola TaxID=2528713 RepID=UPI001074C33A|nr:hypothetical protein [Deinococcus fonticola]